MTRTAVIGLAAMITFGASYGLVAQVAPEKPAAAASVAEKPDAQAANSSPATRAASPSSRSKASLGLSSAVARIQERIATETGPNAKGAATRTTTAPTDNAPAARARAAARRAPAPTRPVTLVWRITLEWPAELAGDSADSPIAR